jgi:alpha-L-arabinofuranosidase
MRIEFNIQRCFMAVLCLCCAGMAASQTMVTLTRDNGNVIINRNIYGHFAEHLGRCIYGGFYTGDSNSTIPNKNGIRMDVVEALKKLKIPVLRWPGGCFADNYHWKDAIGPKNKRKHIENVSWGNVREDNSFGTNEFLQLCEMMGAEPYLAVNMGGGTVQEAAEWVQYVNHANGTSYLTDLREQSGRTNPWHVKYWGVGNESWDCGGHMTAEYYVNEYKKYATFLTSYSNTEGLFRIAVGPGWEDFNWTETVMRGIPLKMIDGLSIHHYSVIDWSKKSDAIRFSEDEYFRTIKQAFRMENMVAGNSAVMDKYDPQKKVALVVDEWGGWYESEKGTNGAFLYQQNTMRDAMIAGLTLNIFNNHADRVRMANLAQCINVLQAVILTDKEKMILTPTYHVMEMYKVHQDAMLLPLQLIPAKYIRGKDTVDAVSVSASVDKEGLTHISLVNVDAVNPQTIKINMKEAAYKSVNARILKSGKLQDHNSFEQPENVVPAIFTGVQLKDNKVELVMPPFSVVVLELK